MTNGEFETWLRSVGPGARVDLTADPRVKTNHAARAAMQTAITVLGERNLTLATDNANLKAGLRWWVIPIAQSTEEELFQDMIVAEAELLDVLASLSAS